MQAACNSRAAKESTRARLYKASESSASPCRTSSNPLSTVLRSLKHIPCKAHRRNALRTNLTGAVLNISWRQKLYIARSFVWCLATVGQLPHSSPTPLTTATLFSASTLLKGPSTSATEPPHKLRYALTYGSTNTSTGYLISCLSKFTDSIAHSSISPDV